MEYKSGIFICPKCKRKMMNIYTDWLNRKIYANNIIETQWIFYNKIVVEENKCECNYFTKKGFRLPWELYRCILSKILRCLGSSTIGTIIGFIIFIIISIIALPLALIFWIIYIILGLLIFIWIDFCRCLCKKKKKYTCLCDNSYMENIDYVEYEDSKIWNHFNGIFEKTLLKKGKHLFICNNCNWHEDTFFEFIPNFKSKRDIIIDNNIHNKYIPIIFIPQNSEFHYAVICGLNETFEQIENKLYKEYPNLKNKNLTFLCKGNAITNKKKTLAELHLEESDIIIFYDNLKF